MADIATANLELIYKNHFAENFLSAFLITSNVIRHCVKGVHFRSYSGPYFPAFGLSTERYGVSVRIESKCGKMRSRIIYGHFSRSENFIGGNKQSLKQYTLPSKLITLWYLWMGSVCRSSQPEVFCKRGVTKNFAKITRKNLCRSLIFHKVLFYRTPPVAPSEFGILAKFQQQK